jgi:hypothetical protein
MATYDTSVQHQLQSSRRRTGLIALAVMVTAGTYFLVVYLREGILAYGFSGSLPLAYALFFYAFSLIPLSMALGRRDHPVRVEMTAESLRFVYADGRGESRPWSTAPIDMAHDFRKTTARRKAPVGMEVEAWVPVKGMDAQVDAIRPQQLTLSGQAFDEACRRMEAAGCRATSSAWGHGRGGTIWRFEPPLADDATA